METTQTALSPEDKNWGMLAHLLTLLGYALGFGQWIPPLIIYLTRKDGSPFARGEARESLNFQITVLLAFILPAPLLCLIITIPFIFLWWILVALAQLVLPVVAAVRAADGIPYRYPLTLRLVT